MSLIRWEGSQLLPAKRHEVTVHCQNIVYSESQDILYLGVLLKAFQTPRPALPKRRLNSEPLRCIQALALFGAAGVSRDRKLLDLSATRRSASD